MIGLNAVKLTSRACLMPCAAGAGADPFVDIFNEASGIWSTAVLSQARGCLAATSLPNAGVAIFAGGAIFPGLVYSCGEFSGGVAGWVWV